MLADLSVSDFAIIRQLTLRCNSGLTVITGETGAGKSIIVDAVSALLGGRTAPDMVRSGASRAIVEGVFDLSDSPAVQTEVESLLEQHGLDLDDGALILTREIGSAGSRSSARVNGRAVPTAMLRELGERLVDIHGQSEHLSLLRAREQLQHLDRFAGLSEQRRELSSAIEELRAVRSDRRKLEEEIRRVRREEALLRHEVSEIEAANLNPEEEDELASKRQRLHNAERLQSALYSAIEALKGVQERPGAVDLLGEAASHSAEAARLDPSLESESELLERVSSEVQESVRTLQGSAETLAAEAGEVEAVEERFLAIADLKRKYGDSVRAILGYLAEALQRLETLERHDAMLNDLEAREHELIERAGALASDLSRRRRSSAEELSRRVQAELADLGMAGTKVEVRFEALPDATGLPVEQDGSVRMLAFDETGVDRIDMLIAPNPGEPPRPLARIASGGELARTALAIKAVLTQTDTRPTLIFDEIDVGVGGRSAGIVGEKLWQLTGEHQVLCVTHMPQVAAFGDHHLMVMKRSEAEQTDIAVEPLVADQQVRELAAMLGGVPHSSTTEASAQELLSRAESWKRNLAPLSR